MNRGPLVIRVQDRHGRGPYRPGFSHVWSDPDGSSVPPWWEELGLPMTEAFAPITDDYHNGCGFRNRTQLEAWFTRKERAKLERLGFKLVAVHADKVYAETPTQVVFGCIDPLSSPIRSCRLTSHVALGLVA